MLANFEQRDSTGKARIWAGEYRNLHNLPHWHLECELICARSGKVTVSHSNTAYDLLEGDCAFINSGEIHYIKAAADSITGILMFDASLLTGLSAREFQLASPVISHPLPVFEVYETIKRELKEQKPFYDAKAACLLTGLIIEIFRQEPLAEPKKIRDSSSVLNYKNLLTEIGEKCSYITFEDACSFMGLSKPYFSKFFKSISGMTFSQYLNIIRLEKAIHLLNHNDKNLSVTEIASLCGFDTIRHFNRVFRDITGFSPRQLPKDYILASHPIKSIKSSKHNFNPTLPSSELLDT